MKQVLKYTEEQIDKIGNTIIYLSNRLPNIPSKTKILKLLYILDELSIKGTGLPFLNLSYELWKFGPVVKDIFIDLSSKPSLLKNYVTLEIQETHVGIKSLSDFDDDEFSQNDIDLMKFVIEKFGKMNAAQLSLYTHRQESPWHNAAIDNHILQALENEEISNTDIKLDLRDVIRHDERKLGVYEDYQECCT